jgi:hypothetical protein
MSDPLAGTNTRNLLQHIISPKIVQGPTGTYSVKTDLINIDGIYDSNGNSFISGGGAVNTNTRVISVTTTIGVGGPAGTQPNYHFSGQSNNFAQGVYLVSVNSSSPANTNIEFSYSLTAMVIWDGINFYGGSSLSVPTGATSSPIELLLITPSSNVITGSNRGDINVLFLGSALEFKIDVYKL